MRPGSSLRDEARRLCNAQVLFFLKTFERFGTVWRSARLLMSIVNPDYFLNINS